MNGFRVCGHANRQSEADKWLQAVWRSALEGDPPSPAVASSVFIYRFLATFHSAEVRCNEWAINGFDVEFWLSRTLELECLVHWWLLFLVIRSLGKIKSQNLINTKSVSKKWS